MTSRGTATLSRSGGSTTAVRFGSPEGGSRGAVATQFSSRSLGEFSPSRTALNKTAIGLEKATSRSLGAPQRRGLGVAEQRGVSFSENVLPESTPLKPLPIESKQTEIAKSPGVITSEQIKSMPTFELPKEPASETRVEVVPRNERAALVTEMKQKITDAYESHPVLDRSESAVARALQPYMQAREKKLPAVQIEPIQGFDVLAKRPSPVENKPTVSVAWLRKLQEKELSKVKDEEEEKTASVKKEKTSMLSQLKLRVATQVHELQRGKPAVDVQSQLQVIRLQSEQVQTEAQTQMTPKVAVAVETAVSVMQSELTNVETHVRRATPIFQGRPKFERPTDNHVNEKKKEDEQKQEKPLPWIRYVVDKAAIAVREDAGYDAIHAVSQTANAEEIISGVAIASHMQSLHRKTSAISQILRYARTRIDGSIEPMLRAVRNLGRIRKADAPEEISRIVRYHPPVDIGEVDSGEPVTMTDVRRVIIGEEEQATYGFVNK